jgi:hypothetical protein
MSKARPNKDAWANARKRWEADPKENFETIGQSLGVSRVAASKQAAKDGWQRVKSLRAIAQKAQLQADEKVTAKLQVSSGNTKTATDLAVDVRASIIETHRNDWEEHRILFPLSAIEDDFEQGKKAKISAEMTMIRQRGEQAAYGLDDQKNVDEVDSYEALLDRANARRDAGAGKV